MLDRKESMDNQELKETKVMQGKTDHQDLQENPEMKARPLSPSMDPLDHPEVQDLQENVEIKDSSVKMENQDHQDLEDQREALEQLEKMEHQEYPESTDQRESLEASDQLDPLVYQEILDPLDNVDPKEQRVKLEIWVPREARETLEEMGMKVNPDYQETREKQVFEEITEPLDSPVHQDRKDLWAQSEFKDQLD